MSRPFRRCGTVGAAKGCNQVYQWTKTVPFEGAGDWVVTPSDGGNFQALHAPTGYAAGWACSLSQARLLAAMLEIRLPRFVTVEESKRFIGIGRTIVREWADV